MSTRSAFSYVLGIAIVLLIGLFLVRTQSQLPHAAQPLAATSSVATSSAAAATTTRMYPYIEVVDSCGPYYQGACVNLRAGPGTDYPVIAHMRRGMVLKIGDTVVGSDGQDWYEIAQDDSLRYPERVTSDWYVAARAVHRFYDDGDHRLAPGEHATTTKRIEISLSKFTLDAYDGDTLFMEAPISPGLEVTPTPMGTFTVYKMTPSRYMQGPIPEISDQYYDLPGVPWNLYFTKDGAVIHGAYWHDHFGQPWSHGCINLSPENAKKLYSWAEIGIPVIVKP